MVCDTFHASFDAALAHWLLEVMAFAQGEREGVPLTWDPIARRAALWDPETAPEGAWMIRRCQLKGMAGAYDYAATGTGMWAGIMLAIGKAREPGEGAVATRRVRVMLGSELLWRHAVKGGSAYTSMRAIIDALALDGLDVPQVLVSAPSDDRVKPSRIDVCVDHFGYEWALGDLERFACRQTTRGAVREHVRNQWGMPEETSTYTGIRTATFYVGKRGAKARFLRVYDKTEEAKVSGKLPWLEPLWGLFGWRQGMKVWRAEVEHGSEYLQAHGCRTLADVIGFERAAWRLYFSEVRHTDGDATRMERASTSEVWTCLERAHTAEVPAGWTWCPRAPSQGCDKAALAKQAAGCAAKLAPLFADGGALLPDDRTGLWAGAPTRKEVRQRVLAFAAPLIEEAMRKQAVAAVLAALDEAMDERERRHLPKETADG